MLALTSTNSMNPTSEPTVTVLVSAGPGPLALASGTTRPGVASTGCVWR